MLEAPDDGKVETLPVPEGNPQEGQQQPEIQNTTLALPNSQAEGFGPGPGTEGCNAGLPRVNPDEKNDILVRVKFIDASGDILLIMSVAFIDRQIKTDSSVERSSSDSSGLQAVQILYKTKSRKK